MITVAEARSRLLSLAALQPVEHIPLRQAAGRTLAEPIVAAHSQPPFAASAMDGYAIRGAAQRGDRFAVVGEAAAGHPWSQKIERGQAVRIFTGAPVPAGADHVLIQENATRAGDVITVSDTPGAGTNIRPAGGDFQTGYSIDAPQRLSSTDLALAAAMGRGTIPVFQRPTVAILMTGDELTMPGTPLGDGMIYASNGFAIAAMLEAEGAEARILPIIRDSKASLRQALAAAAGADLVITIGGASVGDHDLIADVAKDAGVDLAFHKVLMRPGKPLLAGRIGDQVLIGLPGNPVSSIVCNTIFVLPFIRAMLGHDGNLVPLMAPLAAPLPANGPREHYMRARFEDGRLSVAEDQDSSLLSVLSRSDALVVRPSHAPAADKGAVVPYLVLT